MPFCSSLAILWMRWDRKKYIQETRKPHLRTGPSSIFSVRHCGCNPIAKAYRIIFNLFIWKAELYSHTVRERYRERSRQRDRHLPSAGWLLKCLQLPGMDEVEPSFLWTSQVGSKGPRTWAIFCCLSWHVNKVRSGAAGIWTGVHTGYQCYWYQLNLLHHNSAPPIFIIHLP